MVSQKALLFICVLWSLNRCLFVAAESLGTNEEEQQQLVHRMKRFLIYNIGGGAMKNVLGILIPVQFGDNSNRSLNLGYNLQSQYSLPADPVKITDSPFLTGWARGGRSVDDNTVESDDSRRFMYHMLETTWKRRGRDGRECLLRAICEVAESPFVHNGMFGEVVNVIFSPHSTDEHFGEGSAFQEARMAGLHHADCQKTYWKCPQGEGFLDSISHFFEH